MLTFASVAMSMNGQALGEFEAVLEPLPDASPNDETMAWWRTQPEAYSAATTNPESPVVVMRRFADWVRSLPERRAFAASPLPSGVGWGTSSTRTEPSTTPEAMPPYSSLWPLSPTGRCKGVPRTGLEPVACRLGGGRSIRLSYRGRTPTLLSQGLGNLCSIP